MWEGTQRHGREEFARLYSENGVEEWSGERGDRERTLCPMSALGEVSTNLNKGWIEQEQGYGHDWMLTSASVMAIASFGLALVAVRIFAMFAQW